jgi:hypothetical protein
VSAYEEALVLEPDNKGTKASIAQAKAKIAELEKKSAVANSSGEHVRRVPCGPRPDTRCRQLASMHILKRKRSILLLSLFFHTHYLHNNGRQFDMNSSRCFIHNIEPFASCFCRLLYRESGALRRYGRDGHVSTGRHDGR